MKTKILGFGADGSHLGAMGAEKRLLLIKEAFRLAQQPHQNQAKLVVALSRTYRTVSCPPSGPRLSAAPHLPPPSLPEGLLSLCGLDASCLHPYSLS